LWQRSNSKAGLSAGSNDHADDGVLAVIVIQDALGIECDDVTNYIFRKTSPTDRVQRARMIGEWLQTEVRMPDGRRGRPPPWWWRTEVLVFLAAALAALLVTAYLRPPFP